MTKEARIYNEEKSVSSKSGVVKAGSYIEKSKTGTFLTLCRKINSKWIKDQNGIPETIKFLEGNIDTTLIVIGLSSMFVDMFLQARKTKTKINTCDQIKFKSFCTVKETTNKTKRQPTR